ARRGRPDARAHPDGPLRRGSGGRGGGVLPRLRRGQLPHGAVGGRRRRADAVKGALLFPGPGMDAPCMGLALAEHDPLARALFACASEEAGLDVARLVARGGPGLARTEVLQPALTAVALGAARAVRASGVAVDFVLGHS